MAEVNRHNLTRSIPAEVKRKVRLRCKFGCVKCRCGLYEYHHFDPPFAEATAHNPDGICCLCPTCHALIERGHLSDAAVAAVYRHTREAAIDEITAPTGPLDFHDGNAELLFGGIIYSPLVRSILHYHGRDIIRVDPGRSGEPGSITAVFCDHRGEEVMRLDRNEWVGDLANWDIEVVGPRIRVRRRQRELSLALRLDPPGRVVVERLDMRIGTAHLLATEHTYAAGRYLPNGLLQWLHAEMEITDSNPQSAAIEFGDRELMERRDRLWRGRGREMATDNRAIVMSSVMGFMIKDYGMAIGSFCGSHNIQNAGTGRASLKEMRNIVMNRPYDFSDAFMSLTCRTNRADCRD